MMDKVYVYTYLHTASIESTAGNKIRLFPSPFLISTRSFWLLAEAFRNDCIAACITALRSTTEEKKSGGYVTVPCSSKVTQLSSTADWLKF